MTLRDPGWLWLLVPVAALIAAYAGQHARARRDRAAFAEPELMARIAPQRSTLARHAAAGAIGLSLVALVLGLARPAHSVQVPRQEAVVMLVVDVSGSMAATDVAPDRLTAAVETAKEFVRDVPPRFQVGLIAFSDAPQVLATPTTDHQSVVDALGQLQPEAGTAAGDALTTALTTIQAALGANPREAATVVLLSDGATTVGEPVEQAAEQASKDGVKVNTIAFGTDQGIVAIRGRYIAVPADPQSMRAVADITGGKTFQAASIEQLRSVYRDLQGRIGYTSERRGLDVEFLAAGLGALVVGAGAALALRGRLL